VGPIWTLEVSTQNLYPTRILWSTPDMCGRASASFSKRPRTDARLMQGWALDVKARDRDETETITSLDEIETLASPAETRR